MMRIMAVMSLEAVVGAIAVIRIHAWVGPLAAMSRKAVV